MAEKNSGWVELLKYPIVVFSILAAIVIARNTLDISFGPITKIGPNGIEFSPEQKGELASIASKLNGAIAEIEQLKKNALPTKVGTLQDQKEVFQAAQTVSDQTAQLSSIAVKSSGSDGRQGYIWIGNFKGTWSPAMLSTVTTGQPISISPDALTLGSEYQTLGNMVVRDGLPENNAKYYEARRSLGTLPRGTRIRVIGVPTAIDRQFAVQYWAKVEVP